jgi:hypothetical protein
VIAYKFLDAGGVAPFTGMRWQPGEWLEAQGSLVPCENGVHGCTVDALAYWLGEELWTVELEDVLEVDTVLVARRGRVLTRVADWPAVMPSFARACAERASELAARAPEDPRIVGLAEEARECAAEGSELGEAVVAAYAAAVAADRLDPDGFASERAWQSRRLADLLALTTP